MDTLKKLEAQSIHILREAYKEFKSLVMLWSIGKDSTVLLWLARKAFFGHVPLPLLHRYAFKIPAMIAYRDKLPAVGISILLWRDAQALAAANFSTEGGPSYVLQTSKVKRSTHFGEWPRHAFDTSSGNMFRKEPQPYTGVIGSSRRQEEAVPKSVIFPARQAKRLEYRRPAAGTLESV
jgi:sulfate adenylyltransferase subunit 2